MQNFLCGTYSDFGMSRSVTLNEIGDLIRERGIRCLCHITRVNNFESILRSGYIISRNELDQNGEINFQTNDLGRSDGYKSYICCSVTRPNPWLLNYWTDMASHEDDFIVLRINTSVVTDSCYFSPVNAATGAGQYVGQGTDGFNAMFAETVPSIHLDSGEKYRRSDLRDDLTTDEQAEVLVPRVINIEQIIDVIVGTNEMENRVSNFLPHDMRIPIGVFPMFFNWKNTDSISSRNSN